MFVHHQEDFCTSSLQYFTLHLYEASSRWHETNHSRNTVSCLYRTPPGDEQLFVRNMSEDTLSEIHYQEKCASCWSFSRTCTFIDTAVFVGFWIQLSFCMWRQLFIWILYGGLCHRLSVISCQTQTRNLHVSVLMEITGECQVYMRTAHHQAV